MMSTHQSASVLILTASYGAGHNSAAAGLHQAFCQQGMRSDILDPIALSASASYGLSQQLYAQCVLRAPALWGLIYEQVDKLDWSRWVSMPPMRSIMKALRAYLEEHPISLILCTYPLFNYMIDEINKGVQRPYRHVAVVTDAMDVSRIWLRSQAELICVTDEYSVAHISQRYAVGASRLMVSSFPSKLCFHPNVHLPRPSAQDLRVLYAAQAPFEQVVQELRALMAAYPQIQLTVLSGKRHEGLKVALAQELMEQPQLRLLEHSSQMDALMREHHLYIGKAGGATTFEAYATAIPFLVNYAELQQELGNVQLLAFDQCGLHAQGREQLLRTVHLLLDQQAQGWVQMRQRMLSLPRRGGALKLAAYVKEVLLQ